MASKLDTILLQLVALEKALEDEGASKETSKETIKEACAIVNEFVQYVKTIQEECIKLLQDRNVDDKQVAQPPFRWDSLRNDTTPFKVPFGPFSD
tara:strand:- start:44 stop:328 length:285 start_codon:yes stop_codon:yes gene_type:complete